MSSTVEHVLRPTGYETKICEGIKVSRLIDGTPIHTGQRVNTLSKHALTASPQTEPRITLATALSFSPTRAMSAPPNRSEPDYRGTSWTGRRAED